MDAVESGTGRRDLAGWLILAWVVVWSALYFQSAVLHRFPDLAGWVRSTLQDL